MNNSIIIIENVFVKYGMKSIWYCQTLLMCKVITIMINYILVDISERQKQQKVAMVLLHLLLLIIGATAGTSHNSGSDE